MSRRSSEAGYLVDSSVAPLFYEAHKGGPDFVDAPLAPYFLAYDHATRPGTSRVLELPISCALNRRWPTRPALRMGARAAPTRPSACCAGWASSASVWLRPSYSSLDDMIALARRLADDGVPLLNLLFHSSEAIVGGSPYNRTAAELDAFLERLERFLGFAIGELRRRADDVREFRDRYCGLPPTRWRGRAPRGPPSMRICHVTPHLPPDQAANALLPGHLGDWAHAGRRRGARTSRTPPRAGARRPTLPGPVTWMPSRKRDRIGRPRGQVDSLREAWRIIAAASPRRRRRRRRPPPQQRTDRRSRRPGRAASPAKPVVLTLYGTEIWHYRREALVDLVHAA